MGIYNKHIEYQKNEVDVHPQTGESKDTIIIDAYFKNTHIDFMGWGTYNKLKLISMEELDSLMAAEGFTKVWEDGYTEEGKSYQINYMEVE